jgi:3-isopropylmalate/(R)-2-methylmalate dehydratase large subunit
MPPRTIVDKIWDEHAILAAPGGEDLLYVDFNLINEGGAFLAFDQLRLEVRTARCPAQQLAVTDHYIPTSNRAAGIAGIANPEIRNVVAMHDANARDFGLPHIDMHHRMQGIAHVIAPELGLAQPGMLITCNDSHTATNGAFGALASPIGASNQLRHVIATQTVWMSRPKRMRIVLDGRLAPWVSAKDLILTVIARIGVGGAVGHAIEYAGTCVAALSMEGRMTICNMSVEAGAKLGIIGPDDTTIQYLAGRPKVPREAAWDKACAYWRSLPSDAGAVFDKELHIDAGRVTPMVSWGTSPEDCSAIDGAVPDPATIADPDRRRRIERSLTYLDLVPGTPLADIRVDRVFIGSCTNSRIEDLRSAATVLRGRRAVVPGMVSPGSSSVKRQAEAEGLDRVFTDAGLEWREPGCAMCNGSNGELVPPGERAASTTNRNFEGRQGRNARTHIMSPAMVAAAAVTGKLTDVRRLDVPMPRAAAE